MIVDTSALLAVLLGEADAYLYADAMAGDPVRLLSTASYVEAGLKLIGASLDPMTRLDRAVEDLGLTLIAVSAAHAQEAVQARARFGRAPARLNFGDCIVYGTAKVAREPLLFKGDGFTHTDVARVL